MVETLGDLVLDGLPHGVAVIRRDLAIAWANTRMRKMFGFGDDVAGLAVDEAFRVPELRGKLEDALRTGRNVSGLQLEYTGGRRHDYFRFAVAQLPGDAADAALVLTAEPVNQLERVLISRQLMGGNRDQQQVAALVDGLPAILWEAELPMSTRARNENIPWTYTFVSQKAEDFLGFPVFQWFSQPDFWIERVHEADRARVVASYHDVISKRLPREVAYRMIAADERVVHLIDRVQPLVNDAGLVHALRGMMLDVTERYEAEAALSRTEAHHRAFVTNAQFGIFHVSPAGGIVDANPALRTMLRCETIEEMEALQLFGERFEPPEHNTSFETEWTRGDGTTMRVRVNIQPVHGGRGGRAEGYDLIAEDVTERHALERQLQQNSKMEALGQFAGGIAHDFNNLLAIILGYASALADERAPPDLRANGIEQISGAAKRAAALTQKLLGFARKKKVERVVLDLNRVVGDLTDLLDRLLGANVRVDVRLAPDLGLVAADVSQLEQIILNLAANARDAMNGTGRLRIETRNNGAHVVLTVEDNGCGMDADTVSRIFEPFYTTKAEGKGTGFGLATVYAIVGQMDGHIEVDTAPGRGTTFCVRLPRTDAPAVTGPGESAPAAARGEGTVLVVDDEEAVRQLTRALLENAGYTVIPAASGEEALARAETAAIDLVVTDIMMAGMSGEELARRLDHLPVLMISACTQIFGRPFLAKPFTETELLDAVAAVLA